MSRSSDAGTDASQECVRFIICREGSKLPIKKAEISRHLTSVCQIPTNQVNSILEEANRVLKKVYGYKLIQVEGKGGIQYIVTLTEPNESLSSVNVSPKMRVLLNAALTHILMSGGAVKEEDMWKFLEKCGLVEKDDQSSKKLLTITFTKQLYLAYNKVGEGDFAHFAFEWGQRAVEETPKMYILQKLAEASGKEPNYWFEQFQDASNEDSDVQVMA